MNKRHANQMASIRKKLIAALAMLLVACIMTVSSTYAWFTLSTAPEVKGITTTVGANGNLEMALGTYDTFFGSTDPSSYVGSSYGATTDYMKSNITWGNLVDLSTGYGLDKITLYPSRLNANGKTLNRTSPLKFPQYGSDGRVTELSDGTLVGAYDSVSGGFINTPGTENRSAGVSGIGSASTMSKRAFAVMNNKAAIESNRQAAQNAAKDAIREYAGTLAAIALKYQNVTDEQASSTKVPEADIAVLKALIAKLQVANNNISESMKAAVQVVLASMNTVDETTWQFGAGLANDKDIDAYVKALKQASETAGVDLSTSLKFLDSWLEQYNAIKTNLSNASSVLPETGEGTWAAIKDSVSALLVASGIKVGGYTISEIKNDYSTNGMSGTIVKALFEAMNTNNLKYQFTANSGIFSDIARLTGKYTSSMAFPEGTTVEGLDLNMLGSKPVEVEPDASESDLTTLDTGNLIPNKGELGWMAAQLEGSSAPATDPNAATTLTDTYGYIIDLLFRTNATESDLLLQTEAIGRVYNDAEGNNKGVAETMGSGSNMTFTMSAEYTQGKIEKLAAGIRVVFFDSTGNILGVAVLDKTNAAISGGAYKMGLRLLNEQVKDGETVTTAGYTIDANGKITIDPQPTFKTDAKLCALTANVKTGVSALVYLDGDAIDNSAAGVFDSLDAMLNLQFASSAQLKPMENADLMGQ